MDRSKPNADDVTPGRIATEPQSQQVGAEADFEFKKMSNKFAQVVWHLPWLGLYEWGLLKFTFPLCCSFSRIFVITAADIMDNLMEIHCAESATISFTSNISIVPHSKIGDIVVSPKLRRLR